MTDAYLDGFSKVASDYGIDPSILIKTATPSFSDPRDYTRAGITGGALAGSLIGALGGTVTGGISAASDENKGRRKKAFLKHLIIGLLGGGALGAIGGRHLGTLMFKEDYPFQASLMDAFNVKLPI